MLHRNALGEPGDWSVRAVNAILAFEGVVLLAMRTMLWLDQHAARARRAQEIAAGPSPIPMGAGRDRR